jgi:diguanylate cyclase (GGDEF)-like protein
MRVDDAAGEIDPKLRRLVDLAALLTGLILTLAVPAAYLSARLAQESAAVRTLTSVYAALVTAAIAQKPTMWQYEEHKLQALVEHDIAGDGNLTSYAITDAQRRPLATSAKEPPPAPTMVEESPLYDATEVVGYYRVERSLRAPLGDCAVVALLALMAALLCAGPLRSLPLRALRRSHESLLHMAKHDALTGLPNRSLLDDRLAQALLHAARYGRHVTVAFMDLDNFKSINDSLGHDIGDQLLIEMSGRLSRTVRNTDTVVRLGGDEFVILMFDQPNAAESVATALTRLMDAVAQPMDLRGHKVQLGCSIGVATYPLDGEDGNTLLKNADAAMYRAKEVGRHNFQFYTAELNAKLKERMVLQDGLLQAMARNEFYLEYQPQVNLADRQLIGVETLIRWRSPELGVVPPVKFIWLAEDSGIIVPLGLWVLRTACLQQVAWQSAGLPAIKMSVNVSPRQFKDPPFFGVGRRRAERNRDQARPARTGDHRRPDHGRRTARGRHHEPHPRSGRAAVDRRLRHRLLEPQFAEELPRVTPEDRPLVREHAARQCQRLRSGQGRHCAWAPDEPDRRGRRRRDAAPGRLPASQRLRRNAGLPLLPARVRPSGADHAAGSACAFALAQANGCRHCGPAKRITLWCARRRRQAYPRRRVRRRRSAVAFRKNGRARTGTALAAPAVQGATSARRREFSASPSQHRQPHRGP